MTRNLIAGLLLTLLAGHPLGAQLLDRALVPRGQLRLQAYPRFSAWDSRFGQAADGSRSRESLGSDLSDPTMLTLFPSIATLASEIEGLTGVNGYTPILGSSQAHITQDVTRIDFGGHIGVTDWLTVGAVLPWMRTRSVVDVVFATDSAAVDLGMNPRLTNGAAVDAFLTSAGSAQLASSASATSICGGGFGAACDAAQTLSGRASAFLTSAQAAYGASPFFPLAASGTAQSLTQIASTLSADLVAAGLAGLTVPMAFATDWLTAERLQNLPATSGVGIDAAPILQTRKGLWAAGDIEVSALLRLLNNRGVAEGGPTPSFSYSISVGFLARLPTALPEDPNVLLDIGTGDAQTDLEGSLIGSFSFGSAVGLTVGARYGQQGATTVTKRVAAPEVVMPLAGTVQALTWSPGAYLGVEAIPSLHLTPELSITGHYRFFHKKRDAFSLIDSTPGLDPSVLEIESEVRAHQLGGGIRYDTTARWMSGEDTRPIQLHLRLLRTTHGNGGQTPIVTQVEVGMRLFKRLWGPRH
jgi:hypothetical protein